MLTIALIDLNPKSCAISVFFITTLARLYTYTIFFASYCAPTNPELYNRISVMKTESGTTIDIGLNNAFKFIGSSVLPA
jgi:hypothetical protein